HVRCVDVLRSPLVGGVSANQIPTQVRYGNHLRWYVERLGLGPYRLPNVPFPYQAHIADILNGTYGSRPVQAHTHLRFVIGGVERPRVEALQIRKRAQAAIGPDPVLDERLLI